jgi:hypothetical protein
MNLSETWSTDSVPISEQIIPKLELPAFIFPDFEIEYLLSVDGHAVLKQPCILDDAVLKQPCIVDDQLLLWCGSEIDLLFEAKMCTRRSQFVRDLNFKFFIGV